MVQKQDKAVFEVLKYPANHPGEDKPVPVGAKIDLSHLSIAQRQAMVDRGVMLPTTPDALTVAVPEPEPEPPKLNKYGLPFGQVPKGKPAPKGNKE